MQVHGPVTVYNCRVPAQGSRSDENRSRLSNFDEMHTCICTCTHFHELMHTTLDTALTTALASRGAFLSVTISQYQLRRITFSFYQLRDYSFYRSFLLMSSPVVRANDIVEGHRVPAHANRQPLHPVVLVLEACAVCPCHCFVAGRAVARGPDRWPLRVVEQQDVCPLRASPHLRFERDRTNMRLLSFPVIRSSHCMAPCVARVSLRESRQRSSIPGSRSKTCPKSAADRTRTPSMGAASRIYFQWSPAPSKPEAGRAAPKATRADHPALLHAALPLKTGSWFSVWHSNTQ